MTYHRALSNPAGPPSLYPAEPALQIGAGQRTTHVEALDEVTSEARKPIHHRLILDPFGNRLEV